MSTAKEIEFKKESLGHALKDNQLRVPRYQRSYAWETLHVTDFLEDIHGSLTAEEDEYFLGTVVIAGSGDDDEVVDGQQRLATTAIVLSAIRDKLSELGATGQSDQIARDYLASKELRSQDLVPKLQLNEYDHEFFLGRVISDPGSPGRSMKPTRDSHARIDEAFALAAAKVEAICNKADKPDEALIDWVDFLHHRARVIWVRFPIMPMPF